MTPPTLAHVLARSMRFPVKRARQIIPNLFNPSQHPMETSDSEDKITSTRTRHFHPRHLFDKIYEKKTEQSTDGPLTSTQEGLYSPKLIRNSMDLLGFLRLAKKMRALEEGLRTFLDATCTTLPSDVFVTSGCAMGSSASLPPSASASPEDCPKGHITPSSAHITLLMDMCANKGEWVLALFLVRHFSKAHPSLIGHAVSLMARHRVAPMTLRKAVDVPELSPSEDLGDAPNTHDMGLAKSDVEVLGWHVACYYLTHQFGSQPHYIPVEAFNVVLSACSRDEDWLTSMSLVRGMGPNPLQGWQSERERMAIIRRLDETKGTTNTLPPDWFCPLTTFTQPQVPVETHMTLAPDSSVGERGAAVINTSALTECNAAPSTSAPPPPDVVSYATLIVTLEHAGEIHLATEVLNCLPPSEKKKITASYAALISVWSNEVCSRKRR
ncbi:unnamed protein product [Phytomonas sp. Hart1]|nr:unnamed protein product [Phytomonas sp. Hart1]|eukprot:CCW69173.1 unnamed protein product [Phytomonas sp. isolate Hart1]